MLHSSLLVNRTTLHLPPLLTETRRGWLHPTASKEQPQFILGQGVWICQAVSFSVWCNWQAEEKSYKEGQVMSSFLVIYWKIHEPNSSM